MVDYTDFVRKSTGFANLDRRRGFGEVGAVKIEPPRLGTIPIDGMPRIDRQAIGSDCSIVSTMLRELLPALMTCEQRLCNFPVQNFTGSL